MSPQAEQELALPSIRFRQENLLTLADFHEGLRSLATLHQRNTNLVLQELRSMASNDAQLTQAVLDLTNAFSNLGQAINAEVASLRAQIQPETDPAITAAYSNIEAIVAQMNQATAAAQAAIAPAATTQDASGSANPPSASSAASSTGSSSSAAGSAPTGDSSSAPASGSGGGTSSAPSSSPASTTEPVSAS